MPDSSIVTAIRLAHDREAELVHRLTLTGFEETRAFPNPSSALAETVDDVRRAMVDGWALLAFAGGRPAGTARFRARWTDPPDDPGEKVRSAAAALRSPAPRDGTRARIDERASGATGDHGVLVFSRMAVVPDQRRQRVGLGMLRWLEGLARALGLDAVETTARSQQPDNRPYYERQGYRITGYGERYGIPDITTYMRKDLEQA